MLVPQDMYKVAGHGENAWEEKEKHGWGEPGFFRL